MRSGELSLENSHGIRLGKFKTVFAPAQEDKLVKHILAMEARLFGFILDDLRSLAFSLLIAVDCLISLIFRKRKMIRLGSMVS